MKKLMSLLSLMLACIMLMPSAALADEEAPYANAGELYNHWYEEYATTDGYPYPEYVTGAYSTDGTIDNLTFAILSSYDRAAAEKEILDQIKDKDSVTFVDGIDIPLSKISKYQDNFVGRMNDETGLFAMGFDEKRQVLVFSIYSDAPKAAEIIDEIKNGEYSAYVEIQQMEKPVIAEETADTAAPEKAESEKTPWWIYVLAIVQGLAVAAAIFIGARLVVKYTKPYILKWHDGQMEKRKAIEAEKAKAKEAEAEAAKAEEAKAPEAEKKDD